MDLPEQREIVSFLIKASRNSLGDFLLSRLNRTANLKRDLADLLNRLVDSAAQAELARLLRDHGEEIVGFDAWRESTPHPSQPAKILPAEPVTAPAAAAPAKKRIAYLVTIRGLTDAEIRLCLFIRTRQSFRYDRQPEEDLRLWSRQSVGSMALSLGKTRWHLQRILTTLRRKGAVLRKRTGYWSYYHVPDEDSHVWRNLGMCGKSHNGCAENRTTDAAKTAHPLCDFPSVPLCDFPQSTSLSVFPGSSPNPDALSVVSLSASPSERPAIASDSAVRPIKTRTDWVVCQDGTLEISVPFDRRVFYQKADKAFCTGKPHREVEELIKKSYATRGLDWFEFRFTPSVASPDANGRFQTRKSKCPRCKKTHETSLVHNYCGECFLILNGRG